ncbi:recombinase family protein [Aeromonas allosaccharophila]|uniref:recombinase family protein n=1 Tax=Aeromonas allosaccharophila TaxID=656 RepID=UPI0005A9D204|nr:recombinase family protein [Aeromonas allosaccharophila]
MKYHIYSRISSTKQTTGVGLDRQEQNALEYTARNHYEVANVSSDIASAYHSKHMEGKLGAFLEAITNKEIETPCGLVVESLDRLGREHELTALSRFIDIVQAGVEIHEISTGIVYNTKDTHLLHVALSIMTRAYNESLMKAKRSNDAIQRKLGEARGGKIIRSNVPAWIDINGSKFQLNEHHLTVKRIFEMYLNGMTLRPIAKYFNNNNIPYMPPKVATKGVKNGEYKWNSSRILTVLASPYVYGVYTPKNGEPIEDYYPACVDHATFLKVKDIRENRQIKAVKINNLLSIFSSCCSCSLCGHSYTANLRSYTNKQGLVETVGMRCNGRLVGIPCKGVLVPNDKLEAYVLPLIPNLDISKLNRTKMKTLDNLKAKLITYNEQKQNIMKLVLLGSEDAQVKYIEIETKAKDLKAKIEKLESKLVPEAQEDISLLALDTKNLDLRRKVNTQLQLMGIKVQLECRTTGTANVTIKLKDNIVHRGWLKWSKKKRIDARS